jgi:heterotetrameric sarcosine oxidase gamma subunit
MADLTTLRRSPLAHLTERMHAEAVDSPRDVRLAEWPFLTMVSLRVDPGAPAAQALESVLAVPLPRVCGRVAESGPHTVIWLGPDEWLVVSQAPPSELIQELQAAVGDAHASVVDVSANRTMLELSGSAARDVLQKGCPADLHHREFQPGQAAATTLARIPLLLWQAGPETYRLLPRSSFADYVARWLLDAMQEFEGPGVP